MELNIREINIGNITYLDRFENCPDLLWGMDYTSGDLYEAEELFAMGKSPESNRLVLVRYPSGEVYEPFKAEKGQYLGKPVIAEETVYCLLVDFSTRIATVLKTDSELVSCDLVTAISLDEVKDCYNLMLSGEPLTLTRQGYDNDFQVIWPQKGSFSIDPAETYYFRQGDKLVFSHWYEDPDYREETVIRHYPDGEIISQHKGTALRMSNGETWLLK